MGSNSVVRDDFRACSEPLQFDLRYLFLLVTLSAVNYSLLSSAGAFIAALALGPLMLTWLIIRFRIKNMVYGLLFGGLVAGTIVALAANVFGPVPPDQILFASLLYPPFGCVFALTYVTHRQMREGV